MGQVVKVVLGLHGVWMEEKIGILTDLVMSKQCNTKMARVDTQCRVVEVMIDHRGCHTMELRMNCSEKEAVRYHGGFFRKEKGYSTLLRRIVMRLIIKRVAPIIELTTTMVKEQRALSMA